MFEITPKEQLLKSIRKGLVQPLPNKYPLLNFEKDIIKKPVLLQDESFVKSWVDHGFFFNSYRGMYDLMHQAVKLQETYELGPLAIEERNLVELFSDNSINFLPVSRMEKTLLCSFSRLEGTTNGLCFTSELHPVKYFSKAENLILFGRSSQVENPENNRFFSDIVLKSEFRIQLNIKYFHRFKNAFLLIDEH